MLWEAETSRNTQWNLWQDVQISLFPNILCVKCKLGWVIKGDVCLGNAHKPAEIRDLKI